LILWRISDVLLHFGFFKKARQLWLSIMPVSEVSQQTIADSFTIPLTAFFSWVSKHK
jgi:hypothetical protein